MNTHRRPANALLNEIWEGKLEYERLKRIERERRHERQKRNRAISLCGTLAPWDSEMLQAVKPEQAIMLHVGGGENLLF
jgi:hypothetical protein